MQGMDVGPEEHDHDHVPVPDDQFPALVHVVDESWKLDVAIRVASRERRRRES
jgi:hypothetical protein